jgi:hypothetical protein
MTPAASKLAHMMINMALAHRASVARTGAVGEATGAGARIGTPAPARSGAAEAHAGMMCNAIIVSSPLRIDMIASCVKSRAKA